MHLVIVHILGIASNSLIIHLDLNIDSNMKYKNEIHKVAEKLEMPIIIRQNGKLELKFWSL